MEEYRLPGINPEPWTAPQFSRVGKGKPTAYKREALRAYQEALGAEFRARYPDVEPTDKECSVEFFFWRELAGYKVGDGVSSRRHVADATNLQKATEDALQGILFTNDRLVRDVRSVIVAQGQDVLPGIVVTISEITGLDKKAIELDANFNRAVNFSPKGNIRPPGVADIF